MRTIRSLRRQMTDPLGLGKDVSPEPRARTVGLLPHRKCVAQCVASHLWHKGVAVVGFDQHGATEAHRWCESLGPDTYRRTTAGLLPDDHRAATVRHGDSWQGGAAGVVVF